MCKFAKIRHAHKDDFIETYVNMAYIYGFYKDEDVYYVYCLGVAQKSIPNWHQTDKESYESLVDLVDSPR